MIKLIALDFNGVIVAGSYHDIAKHLAEKYGMDKDHVYSVMYGYHNQAAVGDLPESEIFPRALKDLGIHEDPREVERLHFTLVARRNEPDIAYAQELRRRGYTVIALSKNVPRAFAETIKVAHAESEFDAFINTYDLGLPKGSRETIERVLREYGLKKPSEMIFVDDQEINLTAAREMGVHTHLYKNFSGMKQFIEKICAKN